MLWLIVNLLLRSGGILAIALLLRRFLARPAQRHALLLASFLLLLAWPLLSTFLPAIPLTVWRQSTPTAAVTVQQFVLASRQVRSNATPGLWIVPLWAALALAGLIQFVAAHLRLHRIIRGATPLTAPEWQTLLCELSPKPPRLLVSDASLPPLTFGLLNPCILLPSACHDWNQRRRRIVLLHEVAHIARRDLVAQFCARCVTAVWWFQPLCWLTLPLLRRESEKACDAMVVAAGIRPSEYAAELLSIARSFTSTATSAGIAMARPGDLENRLNTLLNATAKPASRRAPLLAVGLLTCITLALSSVTVPSEPQYPKGLTMKHSLIAGLFSAAGLTAATLGGSLFDPSGASIPDAKASLIDPDTGAKFETTTAKDGKFSFESLPAGQYILRVQKPGFATLFREFNLKSESKVERGLTLSLGSVKENVNVTAEGTPAPEPAPKPATPLRVGGQVAQANLVTKINPVYPIAAKKAGVQGTVTLETVISKEGEPLDIRVISSPSDDLTQSALEAVRQWRYRPTLLNGNPVEIVTEVVVNYTLMK